MKTENGRSATRIAITVAAIVVLSGVGWLVWQNMGRTSMVSKAEWEAVPVTRQKLVVQIDATGTLQPAQEANLTFGTAGTVDEVLVTEGQKVKAGDLLARLDTEQLELAVRDAEDTLILRQSALRQAQEAADENDLAISEADIAIAQANLEQLLNTPDEQDLELARLSVEQARNNLWAAQMERDAAPTDTLRKQAEVRVGNAYVALQIAELQYAQVKEGVDEYQLSIARAQLAQAQTRLAKLEAGADDESLLQLETQVRMAETALERARVSLDNATLRAPFAGTVVEVNVSAGEVPVGAQPAVVLIDSSSFSLELNVDEIDVGQLATGQEVEVTFDSLPDTTVTGEVRTIAEAANALSGSVAYRTVIDLTPTDDHLRSGMSADAAITVKVIEDALVIPNWLIQFNSDGQAYVEKLVSAQTVRTDVELGARNGEFTQVLSGLREGDQVAIPTSTPPQNRGPASFFGPGGEE
ncbi:MAG: efflux RND transporter periplasmic adaptor subunit [Chloroflexota bacterium]|nr:efflux RND transporter periplasmic adaptor subunit [Chloroflexota bacterium]